MTYSFMDDETYTSFVYFSSSYFREIFTSKYREWLKPMLEHKIVESDKSWSTVTGKSIHYRIFPDERIDWESLGKKAIIVKNRNYYEKKDIKYFKELQRFYYSLKLDYQSLFKVIFDELSKEEDAVRRGNKKIAWLRSLVKLQGGSLYAHRNATNNRLDTNFTSLPKGLMNEIKRSNGLIEIDAINSQPAILANLIKDKVKDGFVSHAINGVLYDKVAEKQGWDREKSKKEILKVIYSQEIYNNKSKKALSKMYPETIRHIDSFKSKHGYRQLSISMQKKESEIYIDGVLTKLYDMEIMAISKHDSIIFQSDNKEQVEKVLKDVLDSHDYVMKIKTD
ncbi:hypothetical protein [Flagellimonas sp. GZD32]|uniref:hypothetical protein n=1 Tax=Flagellimonas cixiensis TaxID=3228750 RepID=UPI0035C8F673